MIAKLLFLFLTAAADTFPEPIEETKAVVCPSKEELETDFEYNMKLTKSEQFCKIKPILDSSVRLRRKRVNE